MNTSTVIGLKLGGLALLVCFGLAFVLINVGLRSDLVLLVLGIASSPTVAVIVSRIAYAAGKKERLVELNDD